MTALHSNGRIRERAAADLHSPHHISLSHSRTSTVWQSATDRRTPPATDDLHKDLIRASAPFSFFFKSPCQSDESFVFKVVISFITRGHSEQGGNMNRTFKGICCNDSLPYTLINTMVADLHNCRWACRTCRVEHIHNCESILDSQSPTPLVSLLSTLPHIPVKKLLYFSMISKVNKPLKFCTIKVRVLFPAYTSLSFSRNGM